MATAPTPGHSSRKKARRQGFRVTIGDTVHELLLRDIGPGDEGLVRQTTGRPLTAYLNADGYGLDSFAVIVWMARRKAGERKLRLDQVFDEFPDYATLNEMTEDGTFEFDVVEDTDRSDEEAAGSHPLPHGAA